jgi:flagella basal body P-ring formation protein FlgA
MKMQRLQYDNLGGVRLMTLALVIALAMGAAAPADTIQLRRGARVSDADVLLRDVARLDGAAAEAFAGLKVAALGSTGGATNVTLAAVRNALEEHGVNWAHLTLSGFAACRVERTQAEAPADAKQAAPAAPTAAAAEPVVANPTQEISLSTPITLRDRVVEMLQGLAGNESGELNITFADRDQDDLKTPVLDQRLTFEPVGRGPLGRVPVVVRRYRGDELLGTHRVTADVSRRVLAVTTTRSVTRGQTITADDVELREVELNDAREEPLTDVKAVVGLVARLSMQKGVTVSARSVRAALMAERGDLITVHCLAGGLMIKTVGRAMQDGAQDDVIEVSNERSRKTYPVRLTGPKQGVMVVDEPAPAKGSGS